MNEIRVANQDTLLDVQSSVNETQTRVDAKMSSRATQTSVDALQELLGMENPTDANLFTVMNALKMISDAQEGGGGGSNAPFGFTHDMRGYVPTDLAWRSLANTPFTFTTAEAADCGDFIIVLGMATTTAKNVHRYSPSTDTWTRLADAPEVVYRCHAAKCNGCIYVAHSYVSPYTKFSKHDPAADTWEQLPDLPVALTNSAGVLCATSNDVYVVGGAVSAQYKLVKRFDTLTNTWYTTGTANVPFDVNGGNGWGCDGEIYVLHSSNVGTFGKYTPSTNTWKTLSACPAPCSKTAHATLKGKLLIAGGDVNAYSHAWQYEPISDTWSRIADNSISMSGGCGATCGDNFYVFGTNYGYNTSSRASVLENPANAAMEQIVAFAKAGQEVYYNVYGGDGFLAIQSSAGVYTELPQNTNYKVTRDGKLKSTMRNPTGILRGWVSG